MFTLLNMYKMRFITQYELEKFKCVCVCFLMRSEHFQIPEASVVQILYPLIIIRERERISLII